MLRLIKIARSWIVLILSIVTGYFAADKGVVSSLDKAISGKKRFIAYSVDNFDSSKRQFSAMKVIPGSEKAESFNGFTFEATEDEADKIADKIPAGWKVMKPKVYHTQILSGCERRPDLPDGPDLPDFPDTPDQPVRDGEMTWGVARVHGVEASKLVNEKNVKVCIIDTGINASHPDLRDRVVGGRGFVNGNRSFNDDNGHGTHVAGTVAASANGFGVVGVSQASLYIVKSLDAQGVGYSDWIADGVMDCVNNGAHVINMSLGSPYSAGADPLITQAVKYAANRGVLLAIAAGNDSGQTGWPASVDHPNVYAVAASDINNKLAWFSSRGSAIDVIAPGVNIKSTSYRGGYEYMDGTSMASPHVAGVMALALAKGRKQLKTINIGLPQTHQGKGLVDALKTVQ